MALTSEQKKNENVAQAIRFGDTKSLSTALVPKTETPMPSTDVISSASLAPQPEITFPEQTPTPNISTAEAQIGALGDSMLSSLQAQLNAQKAAAQESYTTGLADYTRALANQTGFSGFLAQQEEQRGIEQLSNEVSRLEGQIRSEQAARNEYKTRIEQQGGGLQSGAAAEYANFARESLFNETNAVIQLGVQSGRLSSAQQAAERMASAFYEQEQNDLKARKELVDANKELFTTAEKRAFDVSYESLQRQLDQQEEQLKLTQVTKIDAVKMAQMNGAPSDVLNAISAATTPVEILRAGGKFVSSDLLEREQLRASIANSWASYEKDNLEIKAIKDRQKQIKDAVANGEYILDEAQMDNAYKIGKDYEAESKEFKQQVAGYNRIIASADSPSAAGDLALIFNYMKMLDPASVVRESEFQTAADATAWLQRSSEMGITVPQPVAKSIRKMASGQLLGEEQRLDFVETASEIYSASLDQQIELENRFKEKAVKVFGLPEAAAADAIQDIRAVGSVSDIAFGIQYDNMSLDQIEILMNDGLLNK